MDRHLSSVVISCNFHIHALRHIRPRLTLDAAKSVAVSIVSARLATVCSMAPPSITLTVFYVFRTRLCGYSRPTSFQCYWATAAAALAANPLACQPQARDHYIPIPGHPHWYTDLPCVLAASASTTEGTALWHYYTLHRPHDCSDFDKHSFAVSALATWNTIPASIHDSGTLNCS